MNEEFATELIEDLEHMRQLLERCIRKLRAHAPGISARGPAVPAVAPAAVGHGGDVRAEIERQRQAIMAQVEQAKAKAMQTAAAAKANTAAAGSPGILAGLGNPNPEML